MTPSPPALVTAAASSGPAATFIPASSTGCLIPKSSVIGVEMMDMVTTLIVSCGEVTFICRCDPTWRRVLSNADIQIHMFRDMHLLNSSTLLHMKLPAITDNLIQKLYLFLLWCSGVIGGQNPVMGRS